MYVANYLYFLNNTNDYNFLKLAETSRCTRKERKQRNIQTKNQTAIKRIERKNERKGKLTNIYINRWVISDFL